VHEQEHALAFFGATAFTIPTILLLSVVARRGRGSVEGRLGMVYVLAGAWSILLLVKNPLGEHGLLDLLKGEIIAISDTDLMRTGASFGAVVLVLFLFRKEFLLISFDREMAVTLKKNTLFWDSLLFLLIGVTISMAVLSVGPLVAFGFLLLPPLTAHLLARNMGQFTLIAAALGGVTAFMGFCLAYRWDLPVGPADVALLGLVYAAAFIARKLFGWRKA
jgi:ABC-type Mn2+/Zn2+ transport system permease subunit